jgi:hypothetical protein
VLWLKSLSAALKFLAIAFQRLFIAFLPQLRGFSWPEYGWLLTSLHLIDMNLSGLAG